VWQVTPWVAEWIASPSNPLWSTGVLHENAIVLELGCGVSGLVGLALSPRIRTYVATDQAYVLKFLKQNILDNVKHPPRRSALSSKAKVSGNSPSQPLPDSQIGNILIRALDWETDSPASILSEAGLAQDEGLNVLINCDCIYNESLVQPLVDTCRDICRRSPPSSPTLCLVAQQVRSPDVFEAWLRAFHAKFQTWRLTDDLLTPRLKENSGFIVHVGILRDDQV
jgi:hypothetical protein